MPFSILLLGGEHCILSNKFLPSLMLGDKGDNLSEVFSLSLVSRYIEKLSSILSLLFFNYAEERFTNTGWTFIS